MGVIGGTFRIFARGTVAITSFGLGLALFARPWPDSPMWTKPMDLVQNKGKQESLEDTYTSLPNYKEFSTSQIFQKYTQDPGFKLMSIDKLIPEAHRYNQVSQGLLNLGSPIVMVNREDGELVLFGKSGNDNLVGLDGKIHNGIILTLLDESLCFCGFDKLPSKRGVTANLKVNFSDKKIIPGSNFVLYAKVVESRGRKVFINGKIESLNEGDLIADANCLLVEPKWFKWLSWVDLF